MSLKQINSHENAILTGKHHHIQSLYTGLLYSTTACFVCGPRSSVGVATELRAGQSGIEFRWGWDFPPVQTDPGAHPASCKMGTGSFPRVKCGRGVPLTTHPHLMPRSWKSRPILLVPLWAVRPVQSLSACTRVHLTLFTTYLGCLRAVVLNKKPVY